MQTGFPLSPSLSEVSYRQSSALRWAPGWRSCIRTGGGVAVSGRPPPTGSHLSDRGVGLIRPIICVCRIQSREQHWLRSPMWMLTSTCVLSVSEPYVLTLSSPENWQIWSSIAQNKPINVYLTIDHMLSSDKCFLVHLKVAWCYSMTVVTQSKWLLSEPSWNSRSLYIFRPDLSCFHLISVKDKFFSLTG